MRRKWAVDQHGEEEAGAGGGCGTGPGEKEAWLQGSMKGRKAERLKINYTHSATGGAKQHLPERQRHLSTTGMRTGSKNFLPAEWSHLPFGEAPWEPCYCWGEALIWASYRIPLKMEKRLPWSFSTGEAWVSGRSHAVTSRSMCCFLPPLWLGKGTLGHWPWSLQVEHSPCTRALSDWALQCISTQESCTYLPLWTLLHIPWRDAPKYKHGWCLRTHSTSRSLCPFLAQPGFFWDLFPTDRIRF